MPKVTLFILVFSLAGMMLYVIHHGRLHRISSDTLALEHHHGGTNCVMSILLITVTLLEMLLWSTPAQAARPMLFPLHLTAAALFITSFLFLRFYFTGLRTHWHAVLAYACMVLFAATLLTGLPMLWNFTF